MSSVRELKARFERKPGLSQASAHDEPRRLRGTTPIAPTTPDASDDTAYTTKTTSAHVHNNALAPPKPPLQPRVSARASLEMQPLAQPPSSKPVVPSSPEPLSTSPMVEPLPPSQPARFLRNVRRDTTSLSDSSTLAADNFPTSDPGLPTVASTLVSNSGGLVQSSLDGLTIAEPNTMSGRHADEPPHVSDHTPLPVTQLFARNAAPLYLPELDDLLEKFPRSEFTHHAPGPLAPMNLLRGRRLRDLVYNAEPTPVWRDWNTLGSTLVNWALSVMGSSAISTFYSLSGLYNAVQIFALILNTIAGHASGRWRQLILGTIPNVLALNVGGNPIKSMAFLGVLAVVCGGLLFWFHRLTSRWMPNVAPEGLLSRSPSRGTHAVPFVSLVLTTLYLPLSTISVHAITWSSDFWPVENPYRNGTNPSAVPPLGPPSVFRDPLDFCWTTTMKKDEFNYAPVIVIIALLTLIFMTFWFPLRLAKTIKTSLPIVEPYDSLGQRRSEHELEMEYQRLLKRDRSPFSFLYNEYKRKWGSFKALYLGVKLTSLLIVTVVSPDSCLALSLAKNRVSRSTLAIARQATLLAAMTGFLVLQTVAAPFVDPVNNASEWTSRMNFVLTSLLGLLVALGVPGQTFWNGWALYAVYILTYGLTLYFTVVNWDWMHRVIKKTTRRVDFSTSECDISSDKADPVAEQVSIYSLHGSLDISPSSKHFTQRIWQESLTTLLLAAPQCRMPASQKMMFVDGVEVTSEESTPPYLLDFAGSPAERHVENLKILREVGLQAYQRPLRMSPSDQQRTTELRHKILQHIIGPDAFWCPTGMADAQSCAVAYFGNAWCIPFPLTVVIRYDHSGSLACITDLRDLEHFIRQNEDRVTEKQREIRIALRCLDKTRVKWPYTHTELVGNRFRWLGGRHYEAHQTTDYYEPILAIQRNGTLTWGNANLASGFGVSLHYARNVAADGSLVGLNDALDLTPQLARFLLLNKAVLDNRISEYLDCLRAYRDYMHREATAKAATLSYNFLDSIYSAPTSLDIVARVLAEDELDLRVRELAVSYEDAFETMDERMRYIGRDAITGWWYLFWDDYWRRNKATIASLATHQLDFDPHYPTSIAYNPLSRPALESFLKQRGLWSATPRCIELQIQMYFHLHWIAFAGSSKNIHIHLGNNPSSTHLLGIDKQSRMTSPGAADDQGQRDGPTSVTNSSGIKAGTNHSDSIMRTRRGYRWETLYQEAGVDQSLFTKGTYALHDHRWHFWHDEIERKQEFRVSWRGRLSQWFGISPLGRLRWETKGLGVDVVLEHGEQEQARYVKLHSHKH